LLAARSALPYFYEDRRRSIVAVLAEALTVIDKTSERFYTAEVYRLKGELLLAQEGSRRRLEAGAKRQTRPKRAL